MPSFPNSNYRDFVLITVLTCNCSNLCHLFGRRLHRDTTLHRARNNNRFILVLTVNVYPNGICLEQVPLSPECASPSRCACVPEQGHQSHRAPSPGRVSCRISSLYHMWKGHPRRACSDQQLVRKPTGSWRRPWTQEDDFTCRAHLSTVLLKGTSLYLWEFSVDLPGLLDLT